MKKILIYKIDNEEVKVFLTKKNIKNMWMKISAQNQIIVSAPLNLPESIVDKFILKNIRNFKQKINFKKDIHYINIEKKFFYLFGDKVFFEINWTNNEIEINSKKILFKNDEINKAIEIYLKKELILYLIKSQVKFEEIMNIPTHKISVRKKTTSWATNHVEKRKIFYSINLAAFNKEVIDYVVVHELSHHVYPNHSADFWNNVSVYCKNYIELRSKLKKYKYI